LIFWNEDNVGIQHLTREDLVERRSRHVIMIPISSSNSRMQRMWRRFKGVSGGTADKMRGLEGTAVLCQSWS
jgi:hypothetical protein